MGTRSISDEKDLRRLTFFDAFYELYDSSDRKQACMALIGQLDSNASQKIADAHEKSLELDVLMADLKIHEALCRRWNGAGFSSPVKLTVESVERAYSLRAASARQAARQFRGSLQYRMAELQGDTTFSSVLTQTLDSLTNGPDLNDVRHEFLEKIESKDERDKNRITFYPLATYYCADEARYDGLLQAIRRQQLDYMAPTLENRLIKGLYVISLLSTDQDLIAYMGNTFHASFQAIDAYTGLIYTAGYYDETAQRYGEKPTAHFDTPTDQSCPLFAFSAEERQACREKLLTEVKAKRLKREEQEEEKRKKEDYDRARRILESDVSTASHLSKAVRLLEGLGEYEDAPELLVQATKRHEEVEELEQLRGDLCRRASELMPRMGWYGNIYPLACRGYNDIPHLPKPDTTRTTAWSILHCDEKSRCVYLWTKKSIATVRYKNVAATIAEKLDMALFGTLPLEARARAKKWASLNGSKNPDMRLFVPTSELLEKCELSDEWRISEPIDPNLSRANPYEERRCGYLVYDPEQREFRGSDDRKSVECFRTNAFVCPVICLDFSLTDEELERRRAEEEQRDAYLEAFGCCERGAWDAAQAMFRALGSYRESERMIRVCRFHCLYDGAAEHENEARHLAYEEAEGVYREAAQAYLKADAAESDADFYFYSGSARRNSNRCLALAETCHASSLLKRIAELRYLKDCLDKALKVTPCELKLADVDRSIREKQKQFDNLSLFDFSTRRELKRGIDVLATKAEGLAQQARDERASMEHETAIKVDSLRKMHAPILAELIARIEKGSSIFFGSKVRNDKCATRSMWHVGRIDGSTLLLVADSALVPAQPYHTEAVEQIPWEKCTLRDWLNSIFLDDTFTKQERALITRQRKSSSDDFVFIPSSEEWDALGRAIRRESKGSYGDIWFRCHAKSPYTISKEKNEPHFRYTSKSKVARCTTESSGGVHYERDVTERHFAIPCIVINLGL